MKAGLMHLLAATFLIGTSTARPAQGSAAEYFVAIGGSDASDGRTEETAFASIQRGLDALGAGDTLTLLPGEYIGASLCENLGSDMAQTLIRARIPGTVILRGDVPAPAFREVDGYRFVYAAPFEAGAFAVLETDTHSILERQVDVAAVEFIPGSFYHDPEANMLYLSPTDLQPPARHRYTVGVHERSGLHLRHPRRVTVEGLAATGFFPEGEVGGRFEHSVSGILLEKARDCVVRECTAWLNGNGITLLRGNGNWIEKCVAYRNYSPYHLPSGNIISYHGGNEVIRHCVSYGGGESGLEFYGTLPAPVRIEDSLAWGNAGDDVRIKGSGPGYEDSIARHNVGPTSTWSVKHVRHNIVGGRNAYNPDMSQDNVTLPGSGLNWNQEFADPDNMDFRLQATSSLRTEPPAERDRGAYPFVPNVFYVKPHGDDAADGLSVLGAWKTLDRALPELRPGDTLYLLAGDYGATSDAPRLAGTEDKPVRIAARGTDRVRILPTLSLRAARHLAFERLQFSDAVNVEGGKDLVFTQCRFAGMETGLNLRGSLGVRITQCEFSGFSKAGIQLEQCTDTFLAGNLFNNPPGVPALDVSSFDVILFSDYNGFRTRDCAWSGSNPPDNHERHSREVTIEAVPQEGGFRLVSAEPLGGLGPLGKPLGTFPTTSEHTVRFAGPFVRSVTDTTANIEWWTSLPAQCDVAWGPTPDCEHTASVWSPGSATLSLTGLTPGQEVYFQIRGLKPRVKAQWTRVVGATPDAPPISFRTRQEPAAPRLLHVAVDGDDAADGLSPATAWRSLNRAAREAVAGDTVRVGGGKYHGAVWIRGSGDTDRPVRWQAAPGETVTLDGLERAVRRGFIVSGKKAIHFDGFRLQKLGLGAGMGGALPTGGFVLNDSDDIRITRCMMDGRGGYSPPLIMGSGCKNVRVRNCVIAANFYGIQVNAFENFQIENNVFLLNSIAPVIVVNAPEQSIMLRNNVITDSLPIKRTVQLFEIPHIDSITQENNCFFLRVPAAERQNLAFFYQSAGKLTLPEWFELTSANQSVAANPRFAGMPELPADAAEGAFIPDLLVRKADLDFPDLFVTDPELQANGVGLEPEAFRIQ